MLLNESIVVMNMSIIIDQRQVVDFVNEVFILYKTLLNIKHILIVHNTCTTCSYYVTEKVTAKSMIASFCFKFNLYSSLAILYACF